MLDKATALAKKINADLIVLGNSWTIKFAELPTLQNAEKAADTLLAILEMAENSHATVVCA